ncbi:hypothetical protein [Pandoraea sp. NPDC087047]|uniref:hypothetical protein n=1 Tax=Pandoraea sp. NPDC087047 TaxID=3364390 RepID=UPI00382EED29
MSDGLVRARPAQAVYVSGAEAVPPRGASLGASRGAQEHGGPGLAVWPAAMALMLVANLAVPTAGHVPRRDGRPGELAHDGEFGQSPGSTDHPMAAEESPDVIIEPLEHVKIKTQYTAGEVLKSIGSASAPFRNFGASVANMYELLTGETLSQHAHDELMQGGEMVDMATGLIPEVAAMRVPPEIIEVVADNLDGKPVAPEHIVSILQNADVRTMARPAGTGLQPALRGQRMEAPGQVPGDTFVPRDVENPDSPRREGARKTFNDGGRDLAIDVMTGDDEAQVPAPARADAGRPARQLTTAIEGEREYLQGYEQQIAADRLPFGETARLVLVEGHHYLRGEAGYYRATRGQSGDHWLIDAPRHDKAQVPLIYDAATKRWQAFAPLRVCGGGCGNSRGMPPDSIALNRRHVDAVLSHLHDDDAQNAILTAYAKVARMNLRRTNRADLSAFRDDSIVRNREMIRSALAKAPAEASLFEQQRLAAQVSATHYRLNPGTEAFCQENAEILFHFLLEGGVQTDCVRMITIHPRARSPHALVLYTESDELIHALELSTPRLYEGPGTDGITGDNFAGFIMASRESTVLLDPWSRVKAVGFFAAKDAEEVRHVLDAAFADIGHQPGEAYDVALTRPLEPRRNSVRNRDSLGSAGTRSTGSTSTGSMGAASASSASSHFGASRSLDPANSPVLPAPGESEIPKGA